MRSAYVIDGTAIDQRGKFKVSATGNVQAGAGIAAKGSINGVNVAVHADAGSVRIAEGEISNEGISGNLSDSDNRTMERDGGIKIGVTDNLSIGAEFKQVQTMEDGKITSDEFSGKTVLTVGGKTYGVSSGNEQSGNSDVKTTSFSIGFGAQLIIGAEGNIKIELHTSTDKKKLDD